MADTCSSCYWFCFDHLRRCLRGGWGDEMQGTKNVKMNMSNKNRNPCDARSLLLKLDPSRPFAKNYRTLGCIGKGAFGVVYKVEHKISGQQRVSKEILLSTVEDKEYGQTELQAMILLDHPCVLKLYEFFEDHVAFYVICELCTGGDFGMLCRGDDWRSDDRQLAGGDNIDEIRLLYLDIFSALVYCHDQGVAHRDLKLENCLIDEKSSIRKKIGKVIDFGLAGIHRPTDAANWMSIQLGTRFYIAPEIADKRIKYGFGCDLWAMGIMLYITVTDEHPVARDPHKMLMKDFVRKLLEYKVMRDRPLKAARISGSLLSLLKGLLEKDTKKRLTAQQVTTHEFFQKTTRGDNCRDSWMTGMNPGGSNLSLSESRKTTSSEADLTPIHAGSGPLSAGFDDNIMRRAMTFRQASHFEKAIMSIASYQEATEEIDALRAAFMKLDVAGNGTLSKEELEKGVKDCGISMTQAELKGLFNALDTDRTGKIHFCEFLASTLHPSDIASQKAINDVFDFFDIDRSGKVKREELVEMLGDEAAASSVISAAKAEGKGYLSKQEFALLMKDIAKNMEARFHSLQTGAKAQGK